MAKTALNQHVLEGHTLYVNFYVRQSSATRPKRWNNTRLPLNKCLEIANAFIGFSSWVTSIRSIQKYNPDVHQKYDEFSTNFDDLTDILNAIGSGEGGIAEGAIVSEASQASQAVHHLQNLSDLEKTNEDRKAWASANGYKCSYTAEVEFKVLCKDGLHLLAVGTAHGIDNDARGFTRKCAVTNALSYLFSQLAIIRLKDGRVDVRAIHVNESCDSLENE
jgi:hypothetical protein